MEMDIAEILRAYKKVAVIGISKEPEADSYKVASYLKSNGYKITPVAIDGYEILDEKCYDSIESVPGEIEIVVICRPQEANWVVEQAIKRKAKVIWMQLGIRDEGAAEKARAAGIEVVMDKSIAVEHKRFQELALIEKTKTFLVPILTEQENSPEFLARLRECSRLILVFVVDKNVLNHVPTGFAGSRINIAQEVMEDMKRKLPQNVQVKDLVEWGDWYDKIENLARLENVDEVVMKHSQKSDEFFSKLVEKGLKVTVV